MPSPIMIISGTNRANSNALRIARIVHGHYQSAKIAAELFNLEDLPREVFDPSSYGKKTPPCRPSSSASSMPRACTSSRPSTTAHSPAS